jgi:ribA/ribD-fused uncharacterized protein
MFNRYLLEDSAVFFKVRDKWGEFSNICHDYPFQIVSTSESGEFVSTEYFQSSEILYQSLKFENLELQKKILGTNNSIASKKLALSTKGIREGWEKSKIDAMRFALFCKFSSHVSLIKLLLSTAEKPIVEFSYKDIFWGAKPSGKKELVGANNLGILLMEMRDSISNSGTFNEFLEPMSKEFLDSNYLGRALSSYIR